MKGLKKRVLIGVSGGPDSMALLDMMKDKYEVYVAHVNYHHRDSALRDELIVEDYCKKYGIPYFKKDYVEVEGGNFQENARIFRYEFYKEIIDKYDLDCVMLAHHKDDLIETYLMQKKRNSHVYYYGLKRSVKNFGIKIVRPLLKYTKIDLKDYCDNHGIVYGIDESNLSDDYQRNRIRHDVIEKMSLREKNELVREINSINKENRILNKSCVDFINKRSRIPVDEFLLFEDKIRLLRIFLGVSVSRKQANELIRQMSATKSFEVLIEDKYLCLEYGYIEVYKKENDYIYELTDIKYFKTKYFKLCKSGKRIESFNVSEDDFPLTIRNYKEGDSIKLRFGTKKLNRFFIDNKISYRQRKMWPVVVNSAGTAIFVPNIGCDINHYSKNANMYMLKLLS